MDQPGTGSGIIGHEIEIIAVRACGFRLLLRVEAFRKPPATFRLLRLDFHRPAESCLRFATFSVAKCSPAQVIDRRDVVGIEMEQSFEGFGSAGAVTRTVQRDGQEISGMALRRKQLHGLPKRRYRGGVLLLVEKKRAEIEIRLGHLASIAMVRAYSARASSVFFTAV